MFSLKLSGKVLFCPLLDTLTYDQHMLFFQNVLMDIHIQL